MKEYVKLSMKEFGLNPLHYVSLPGYSFECWLMSSGATLDTIQDEHMLDEFVEAKTSGVCGIMGDRCDSNNRAIAKHGEAWTKSHYLRSIWYIDASKLYGYARMQKLPYKDFEYYSTSLDEGGNHASAYIKDSGR